jgi:hypothetical protein
VRFYEDTTLDDVYHLEEVIKEMHQSEKDDHHEEG